MEDNKDKESPMWVQAWGVIAFVIIAILAMPALIADAKTFSYGSFAAVSLVTYFVFIGIGKEYYPKKGTTWIRSGSAWDFILKTAAALAAVTFISAGIGFAIKPRGVVEPTVEERQVKTPEVAEKQNQ